MLKSNLFCKRVLAETGAAAHNTKLQIACKRVIKLTFLRVPIQISQSQIIMQSRWMSEGKQRHTDELVTT